MSDQKVAIVTGASRGIGLAIAQALAAQGYKLAICSRSEGSVNGAKDQIEGDVFGMPVDVSSFESITNFVQAVMDQYGRIDVVVNNAGITKDNLLLRMKPEDFTDVVTTNLNSIFNMTKAVLKPMLKQKHGRIINISSVVGCMGNPGQANYAAAKAGIMGFTKSIAKEVGAKGITTNVVAPGFIQTDMIESLPEQYLDNIIAEIPLKRLGHATDVANLVTFLASDQASYITGQVIQVDGGILM